MCERVIGVESNSDSVFLEFTHKHCASQKRCLLFAYLLVFERKDELLLENEGNDGEQ